VVRGAGSHDPCPDHDELRAFPHAEADTSERI
jgi:hypothetical protein